MQLLEGQVAQPGIGGLGQLVGQLLDLAVQGATGIGHTPVGVQQAPARERGRGVVPFGLAPAAVVPQQLHGDGLGPGGQHVRLQAADAVRDERRHMPVAAVLAQRRAALPDLAEPPGPERGRNAGPQ